MSADEAGTLAGMLTTQPIGTLPGTAHGRVGFTLVELLTVVGIIAILIGLLFPVITRTRDVSRTIVCIANLRGIGQAFGVYRSKHDNLMPPPYISNPSNAPSKPAWRSQFAFGEITTGDRPLTWADVLIADGGATRDLLDCPANAGTGEVGITPDTVQVEGAIEYAINGALFTDNGRLVGRTGEPFPGGEGDSKNKMTIEPNRSIYEPWFFSRITRPSEGLLVIDNAAPKLALAHVYPQDSRYKPRQLRHSGRDSINILFFDGHVETRQPGRTTSPRDAIFDNSAFGAAASLYAHSYASVSGYDNHGALRGKMPTPLWRPWKPYF